MRIAFHLDGSVVPAGATEATIQVFRNGIPIANCTGAPQAIPDPCVSQRALVADDVELTVLSSHASVWNFGTADSVLEAFGPPVSRGENSVKAGQAIP